MSSSNTSPGTYLRPSFCKSLITSLPSYSCNFNSRINPFTESTIPEVPIEVHSNSSEEDVEKVVDWTQKTLSTLSEIKRILWMMAMM